MNVEKERESILKALEAEAGEAGGFILDAYRRWCLDWPELVSLRTQNTFSVYRVKIL